MLNKYYRNYIKKLIDSNPATITIKRKINVDDGYGGEIITETEVTEAVAFYNRNAKREIASEHGLSYTGVQVTKILTGHDADIQEGDTFEHESRKYRVLFVKNYYDICKQIELDVMA